MVKKLDSNAQATSSLRYVHNHKRLSVGLRFTVSRPARPAAGQWFGKMPGGGGGLEGGAGLVGETQTPSLGSLGHHSSGRLLPIQTAVIYSAAENASHAGPCGSH
ncbi:unnamed protein product [Boreogadus saida]